MSNVYSMTGFGAAQIDTPLCQLHLQLKSVNSRYLDLNFKIPEELVPFEGVLRDAIAARIKRGKIECKVSWQAHSLAISAVEINTDALTKALALQNTILQHAPQAMPLSVAQIMQLFNVLPSSTGAANILADITAADIDALAQAGINAFLASRATEGAHLSQTLNDRLTAVAAIVDNLRIQLPELLAHQEAKLTERLFKAVDAHKTETAISRDEMLDRIRTEASLTTIRVDVAEELDRLDGHIANTTKILKDGSSIGIGKKLDFLMQEFNREANTLGSKSASLLQTQASMEMKIIIEQMREQVQNLE